MKLNIRYSKTPKRLPVVLAKDETKRLIDSIGNNKHRLMIKLMYSPGLRVSELVNLKIKDFEFENNHGWVREGKGRKDRLFIIAESINNELQEYIKNNNVADWLFPGKKKPLKPEDSSCYNKRCCKESKNKEKCPSPYFKTLICNTFN